MTFKQIDEYDKFKKEECDGHYSYLKRIELLDMFLNEKKKKPCIAEKFGKKYFRFHDYEMDELVEWVYEKRKSINMGMLWII